MRDVSKRMSNIRACTRVDTTGRSSRLPALRLSWSVQLRSTIDRRHDGIRSTWPSRFDRVSARWPMNESHGVGDRLRGVLWSIRLRSGGQEFESLRARQHLPVRLGAY